MKRNKIREEVEQHLAEVGFRADAWAWHRSELVVAVGGALRRAQLKAGMSRRALTFELGRISGWAEIAADLLKPLVEPQGVAA